MRRYFFRIDRERGTDEVPEGITLSGYNAAMLHAVTLCAEIGSSDGFYLGFSVSVRDEHGAAIGRVSVVVASATSERRDA
jgi:hypothetical protein